MWRHFDVTVADVGMILMICGALCVILGVTRRAYAPRVSLLWGILLLLCGGALWLLPQLDLSSQFLTRLSFLSVGATFLAADLVYYFKRRKCTVPCQGAFLDTAVYGRKGTGLQYGAAVFRYQADGVSYDQASLDKRFWLGFLTSPFSKTFKEGDHCTIYLNPNNPRRFAISRRPRLGLFTICAIFLFVAFFRS